MTQNKYIYLIQSIDRLSHLIERLSTMGEENAVYDMEYHLPEIIKEKQNLNIPHFYNTLEEIYLSEANGNKVVSFLLRLEDDLSFLISKWLDTYNSKLGDESVKLWYRSFTGTIIQSTKNEINFLLERIYRFANRYINTPSNSVSVKLIDDFDSEYLEGKGQIEATQVKFISRGQSPYSRNGSPIQDSSFTIHQIALIHYYNGIQITKNNASEIVKKFGRKSGQKLYQTFCECSMQSNRTGDRGSVKKLQNQIERIEKITEQLSEPGFNRANDELQILKDLLKRY